MKYLLCFYVGMFASQLCALAALAWLRWRLTHPLYLA